MRIRYLGWAGVEVTAATGESLVIDHVADSSLLAGHLTGPWPVAPLTRPIAGLVTHLHDDHSDAAALVRALGPGGTVLRPTRFEGSDADTVRLRAQEQAFGTGGLDAREVAEWEQHRLGPFTVTAVPAIDGIGDPQLNWVVEADGIRLLHGGDTLFHGFWWLIARRLGPIHVAVLPVNGPEIVVPGLEPATSEPAVMTPRQALEAARLLRAGTLVPIHYGMDWPGAYTEVTDPLGTLHRLAEFAGPRIAPLAPGEALEVPEPAAR